MFDILCLSDCCCDLIFQGLPALPTDGGEQYCQSFALRAGGGANTPMGLARLGSHTAYAATLGDDELGQIVLTHMRQSHLDEHFLRIMPGGHTWVSAALSTSRDRAFASYAGDSTVYTHEELAHMVSQTRWLHTYVSYVQQYPALPQLCRAAGVPLSLDLSYDPSQTLDQLRPVLSQAQLITPNKDEALALTGASSPEAALDVLLDVCPQVVITLGAQGCLAQLDGQRLRACPPPVQALDTTGAGDLFNAGLLYARLAGRTVPEQLAWACASGAAAVGCLGGLDDHYTRERVAALAQQITLSPLS